EVYDGKNGEDDDRYREQFSNLKEGIRINDVALRQTSGETAPPERFTEGELLQAMENPSRGMHARDRPSAKTRQHTGGRGTVATRADKIEKLFDKAYTEKKGQSIHMTSKGAQLLDLVPTDLRSPELTAEWEQKLRLIAEGKTHKDTFIQEMKRYTKQIVK